MPLSAFRESISLLRSARFGTFWVASLLSNIGTWAQMVAQPWLLLSLGASSFLVGLDSFAMSAPVWVLSLLGGLLADRADRRRVIALFQSIQMLCPSAIIVLLLFGHIRPWMIIGLSIIVGITDALSMPAFSSIVPSIVAREQIAAGLALNSTQFNVSRIAGPAIAGVLMATIGITGCFAISALSYVPLIAVAVWILPAPRSDRSAEPVSADHSPPTGAPPTTMRMIMRRPDLRAVLLSVLSSALLCAPLVTFYPVLLRNVLHQSAASFSIGVTTFGVGGLLGALALLGVPSAHDRRPIVRIGAIAYGLCLIAVACMPEANLLPAVLLIAGVAMSMSNIAANTYLQQHAGPAVRGRVTSLYMLAMRGGIAFGAIATGWAADRIGVRNALLVDGTLAALVQVVLLATTNRSARGKASGLLR